MLRNATRLCEAEIHQPVPVKAKAPGSLATTAIRRHFKAYIRRHEPIRIEDQSLGGRAERYEGTNVQIADV